MHNAVPNVHVVSLCMLRLISVQFHLPDRSNRTGARLFVTETMKQFVMASKKLAQKQPVKLSVIQRLCVVGVLCKTLEQFKWIA